MSGARERPRVVPARDQEPTRSWRLRRHNAVAPLLLTPTTTTTTSGPAPAPAPQALFPSSPVFERQRVAVVGGPEAQGGLTQLAEVAPSHGRLLPEFAPARFAYVLNVPAYTTAVSFHCTAAHPEATEVSVNNRPPRHSIPLLPMSTGTTKAILSVVSHLDRSASNYVVEIVRGPLPDSLVRGRSLPPMTSPRRSRPTPGGGSASSSWIHTPPSVPRHQPHHRQQQRLSDGSDRSERSGAAGSDRGQRPLYTVVREAQRRQHPEASPSPSPPPSPLSSAGRLPRYRAVLGFTPVGEGQMRLRPGDVIAVTEKRDPWWTGFKIGDAHMDSSAALDRSTSASQAGWFPSQCVELLGRVLELDEDESGYLQPGSPILAAPAAAPIYAELTSPPSEDAAADGDTGTTGDPRARTTAHVVWGPSKSMADVLTGQFDATAGAHRNRVHWPFLTVCLLVAQAAILAAMLAEGGLAPSEVNPMFGPDANTLRRYGARSVDALRAGQVYRLLTATVVPVGLVRFFFDVVFHLLVCLPLERIFGSLPFALVYALSGAGGHLVAAVFLPTWVGAGPGPALFGSAAALLSVMAQTMQRKGVQVTLDFVFFLVVLALAIVLGLFPGLDNWSQLGGLVFGFMLALCVVTSTDRHMHHRRRVRLRVIGALALLLSFGVGLALLFALVEERYACRWCMSATCIDAYAWCSRSARLVGP